MGQSGGNRAELLSWASGGSGGSARRVLHQANEDLVGICALKVLGGCGVPDLPPAPGYGELLHIKVVADSFLHHMVGGLADVTLPRRGLCGAFCRRRPRGLL
jgi:hypothetical protein